MTHILQTINGFKYKLNTTADYMAGTHPYLSFFCVFIGIPLFMLFLLFASTTVIMLPFAYLCGWV